MKKWVVAILLVCMTMGMAGCGKEEIKPMYSVSDAGKNIGDSREDGGDGCGNIAADTEMLSEGINAFALKMYGELPGDENIFFSPYSLCSALSLLNVSAGGETKAEIEEVLGISDFDTWNAQMLSYLEKEWTKDTFVLSANSVWLQQGHKWADQMETGFLQPAAYYYKGETYEVDFLGDYDNTVKSMNQWASDHTNGMIKNIAEQTPRDTVLALMNAVYFEGKWSRPFLANYTREQTFHGIDGDVTVDMMNEYDLYIPYIEKHGIKGISLPYKDSSVVMKIFIPTEDYSNDSKEIHELFAKLL